MSNITIRGLEEVIKMLEKRFSDESNQEALEQACLLVENEARQKAPKGDGHLRRSISHRIEGEEGIVYTPLEYAPYVEYGTGAFAEKNPTSGYWVYVLDSSGSSVKAKSSKRYTLERAKQIVAMMREDGLEAVYTQGRYPKPFMRPALDENRNEIIKIFREGAK